MTQFEYVTTAALIGKVESEYVRDLESRLKRAEPILDRLSDGYLVCVLDESTPGEELGQRVLEYWRAADEDARRSQRSAGSDPRDSMRPTPNERKMKIMEKHFEVLKYREKAAELISRSERLESRGSRDVARRGFNAGFRYAEERFGRAENQPDGSPRPEASKAGPGATRRGVEKSADK